MVHCGPHGDCTGAGTANRDGGVCHSGGAPYPGPGVRMGQTGGCQYCTGAARRGGKGGWGWRATGAGKGGCC